MENIEFKKSEIFQYNNEVDYAAGSVVSKTIVKKATGNVTLFAFDKNQGLSEHSAPFDALIQIIDGKAEIIIGGKSFIVNQNESIIMPANIPHSVRAIEQFKMILTMIKSQ